MSNILLSIKPTYVDKILNGSKKIELRKNAPNSMKSGGVMLIYCTSPNSILLGYAIIDKVISLPKEEMWKKYHARLGINRKDYNNYFSRYNIAYGYVINNAHYLKNQIPLHILKSEYGLTAPQSYIYPPKSLISNIKELAYL